MIKVILVSCSTVFVQHRGIEDGFAHLLLLHCLIHDLKSTWSAVNTEDHLFFIVVIVIQKFLVSSIHILFKWLKKKNTFLSLDLKIRFLK